MLDADDASDRGDDDFGWVPSSRARRAEDLASAVLAPGADLAHLHVLMLDAAAATGAANAQISMLTNRQIAVVVHSRNGAEDVGPCGIDAPYEDTICATALRVDDTINVPDARADERFNTTPGVLDGRVGAYLGAPIRDDVRDVLGVLCVYDPHPRIWSEPSVSRLAELAGQVHAELVRIQAAGVA